MKEAVEMRSLMEEMKFVNIEMPEYEPTDFRSIHHRVSFDNPISLYINDNVLNEGLIKTYPIDKTIEYITSYFKLNPNQIHKMDTVDDNTEEICAIIPDVGDNMNLMDKAMAVCGYHRGAIMNTGVFEGVKWMELQYEPKNQADESQEIRREETHLYHLTPMYNEEKILSNGFSPRCRNSKFSYPGRIYFINGSTDEEHIVYLGEQLSNINRSKGNTTIYTIFDIDVAKIPENISMYRDPNYRAGIFISENLSPNCITGLGHIDYSEDEPFIDWDW